MVFVRTLNQGTKHSSREMTRVMRQPSTEKVLKVLLPKLGGESRSIAGGAILIPMVRTSLGQNSLNLTFDLLNYISLIIRLCRWFVRVI